MRKLTLLAAALVPPFLIACADDGLSDPPTDDGWFTVTLSGSNTGTFSGFALFDEWADPDAGDVGWILWLSNATDEDPGKSIYIFRDDVRPATGTYPIVNPDDVRDGYDDFVAYYADLTGHDWNVVMHSQEGGSLTATHSTSERVQGTFQFQAAGSASQDDDAQGALTTFTGEFDARRGTHIVRPSLGAPSAPEGAE